jgi:hypothetical protein
LSGLLAMAVWLLLVGCGSEPANKSDAGDSAANLSASPMEVPPRVPVEALRLPGEGTLVLARGLHGIELTLAEYNVRADEVQLPAETDTTEACWATLERLVKHKVCVAEGRLRGYTATDARNLRDEERQLARQVLEQGMLSAQFMPNEEALTYFRGHPELFPDLTEADLAEPALLTHVKFTLHNERWIQTVNQWLTREKVVVDRDRFTTLLNERGRAPMPAPPQEGKS